LTRDELLARLRTGPPTHLLDVRTRQEFAAGHVPGAVNVPFTEIARRLDELPARPSEELVVYCGHGPRAWIAARTLRQHGYRAVTLLRGHWAGWQRAGLPIERPAAPRE
jgi:rhodanese-related sulfurtransferase